MIVLARAGLAASWGAWGAIEDLLRAMGYEFNRQYHDDVRILNRHGIRIFELDEYNNPGCEITEHLIRENLRPGTSSVIALVFDDPSRETLFRLKYL